ncbi:hypothetical protein [Bacteroides sp. GM023]|uniref:hypothetical protein n=1 Tax=Bacteroides sp. GM023 TaxID=2723058 RepID=UPI00168A5779|nr:hypothetical protein [Bacteroides sp. GM023]
MKKRFPLYLFTGNTYQTDNYLPVKKVKEMNSTLLCLSSFSVRFVHFRTVSSE